MVYAHAHSECIYTARSRLMILSRVSIYKGVKFPTRPPLCSAGHTLRHMTFMINLGAFARQLCLLCNNLAAISSSISHVHMPLRKMIIYTKGYMTKGTLDSL